MIDLKKLEQNLSESSVINPLKIPFPLKLFLIKWSKFTKEPYKELIKYNLTNKFRQITVEGENISNDNLIVQNRPILFFYESDLKINEQSIDFLMGWTLLAKKKQCKANISLCNYLSAILAQQCTALLLSVDYIQKADIKPIILGIASKLNQRYYTDRFQVRDYEIRVSAMNTLPEPLGAYHLSISIRNKEKEETL